MEEKYVLIKVNDNVYEIESTLSSPETIVFWLEAAKKKVLEDSFNTE